MPPRGRRGESAAAAAAAIQSDDSDDGDAPTVWELAEPVRPPVVCAHEIADRVPDGTIAVSHAFLEDVASETERETLTLFVTLIYGWYIDIDAVKILAYSKSIKDDRIIVEVKLTEGTAVEGTLLEVIPDLAPARTIQTWVRSDHVGMSFARDGVQLVHTPLDALFIRGRRAARTVVMPKRGRHH